MTTTSGASARKHSCCTAPVPMMQSDGTTQLAHSISPSTRQKAVQRVQASGSPIEYVRSSVATTCAKQRNILNFAMRPIERPATLAWCTNRRSGTLHLSNLGDRCSCKKKSTPASNSTLTNIATMPATDEPPVVGQFLHTAASPSKYWLSSKQTLQSGPA
eukprot:53128-Prymnesium_polylepis.2